MRILKLFPFVAFLIAIFLLCSVLARAETFLLTEEYNVPIIDVNKSWRGDSKLCAVAAVSNALTSILRKDERFAYSLYDDFKNNFGNRKLIINEIWDYVWQEKNENCWMKYYSLDSWVGYDLINIDRRIIGSFYEGWIVLPMVKTPTFHVITSYGFKKDASGLYILYVDSDDKKSGYYWGKLVKHKDGWYLDFYDGSSFLVFGYTRIRIIS